MSEKPGSKVIMLGNAAIARGAYEAGVKVSAAYPGTPSTEISENLVKYKDELYCEWSPNEKVAMEVAIGASFQGVRAMASMKHVGVNVAADPLYTISYSGVNGGLVLVAADDPGLYSSQNEQDSRLVARAALIPVIEPSDSEEARVFMKRAFEISEQYDTPVMLRTTTRLAHSQCIVNIEERQNIEDKPYVKNIRKNVMMPGMAKARHIYVEERLNKMSEDGYSLDINKVEYQDTKIGVITSGIPYQYVKEALPNASVLKLGMVYPLPRKLIEEFASKVDTLYVVEELEPAIETQIKAWGINCIGKDIFTVQGEYSANMIRKAILGESPESAAPAQVPARPPILCPGCPHRAVYSIIKKLKKHVAGDIGCYTLGAVAPLEVLETCVCMGSSISTLHGMEKAKGSEYIKDWVACIGDSTFLHTGVNSLMNMCYNKSTGTVIILDNSITGMTGHQQNPTTGKRINGDPATAVDLEALPKACGISRVLVVDPYDIPATKAAIAAELDVEAPSLIISRRPCALLKEVKHAPAFKVDAEACVGCKACMKIGCPAISIRDKKSVIDFTQCVGCGMCKPYCPVDAIKTYVR